MEFLDVLDENGKKTGVVRNRELIKMVIGIEQFMYGF